MLDDLCRALYDGGGSVSLAAAPPPGCIGVPCVQTEHCLAECLCQAVAVIPLVEAEAIHLLGYLHDAFQVGRLPHEPWPPQFPIKLAEQPTEPVLIFLQGHKDQAALQCTLGWATITEIFADCRYAEDILSLLAPEASCSIAEASQEGT